MNKVHLLEANRSYDRDEQTVSVNQVVMLEGYSYNPNGLWTGTLLKDDIRQKHHQGCCKAKHGPMV